MTVNPGLGHQHFLGSKLSKIRRVAQMIARLNTDCELDVDGGIDKATVPMGSRSWNQRSGGGTPVFGADKDVAAATESLRDAETQVGQ